MTSTSPADVPRSDDPQLLARLAAGLRSLNYTVDGVEALLGAAANAALNREQPVPAQRRVDALLAAAEPDPLAVVVQLWLLGQLVSTDQWAAAVPDTTVLEAAGLGLIEPWQGQWRAAVDLRPHSADDGLDLWVTSDLGAQQRPGVLRRDYVLGIGQASLSLAQLTPRAEVDRALDLGTGCGVQIFHLLSHARTVVATDLSARALAFARFNLVLNAQALGLDPHRLADRVELRQGNLLEPVAGEKFDLVVSNPPFVITPRRAGERAEDQYTYRDGGLAGDGIVAALARQVPDVLAPGGVAVMLGNWEMSDDDDAGWHRRIAGWLPDEVDAWVIQRERLSPEEYAETWLRDASEQRDPALYESAYLGYLEDFAARNVAAVGFGTVWLRRPASGNGTFGERLRRFEQITHPIEQPVAAHLTAAAARHDWLASNPGQALLDQRLTVPSDVTEERHQRPGAEHPAIILLRQGSGLRRTTMLRSETAGFVSVCDGELTVGQIITALAALLEPEAADFETVLLSEVRALIRDGFLIPAQGSPEE